MTCKEHGSCLSATIKKTLKTNYFSWTPQKPEVDKPLHWSVKRQVYPESHSWDVLTRSISCRSHTGKKHLQQYDKMLEVFVNYDENEKLLEITVLEGTPQFHGFLHLGTPPSSHSEDPRIMDLWLWWKEGKNNHCKIHPECFPLKDLF